MTAAQRFPSGHKFGEVTLEDRTLSAIEDVPASNPAPGRYWIGEPSKRVRLDVELHGDAPAKGGSRFVSGWNGKPTEAVRKSMIVLEDALHLGQAIIADRNGCVFPESAAHEGRGPARGDALVKRPDGFYAEAEIAVEETVEEPVLYLGNATGQFGHFLLDFSSRMWAVDWARAHGLKIGIFMVKRRQKFLPVQEQVFAAMGLKEDDFVFLTEPARLRRLYLPSPLYMLHRGMHPEFLSLCARLGDDVTRAAPSTASKPPGAERVYLSRRLWAKRRILTNEAEVEAMFARYGFEIAFPEQLPFNEQIALVRNAQHVAAPIGSQTYLTLFQNDPKSTIILAPTTFTFGDDAIISAMRDVRSAFVLGAPPDDASGGARNQDFPIDLGTLERVLKSWFTASKPRQGKPEAEVSYL